MKRVLSTTDNPTSNGEDKHGGEREREEEPGNCSLFRHLASLSLSPPSFLSATSPSLPSLPLPPSPSLTPSLSLLIPSFSSSRINQFSIPGEIIQIL